MDGIADEYFIVQNCKLQIIGIIGITIREKEQM